MPTRRLGLIHVARPATVPTFDLLPMARKQPPPVINWHKALPANGDALGNDAAGDCVEAAAYQTIALKMANAWGSTWRPAAADVIAYYERLTGYNPAQPASDQGTATDVQMRDWVQHGIHAGPQVLDIVHWLGLHHQDVSLMQLAIAELGPIELSLALPVGLERLPVNAPWTVSQAQLNQPDWQPGSWGYHRVVSGGYDARTGDWTVRTWGVDVQMSSAFWLAYGVGADATLSRLWFNSHGVSPRGEVWDQLLGEFRSIQVA